MEPLRTYSPLVFGLSIGLGAVLFAILMAIAWTSDTAEVGLDTTFKLELSAAAVLLGGGLVGWGLRYRARAIVEAEEREMVRRSLGG